MLRGNPAPNRADGRATGYGLALAVLAVDPEYKGLSTTTNSGLPYLQARA